MRRSCDHIGNTSSLYLLPSIRRTFSHFACLYPVCNWIRVMSKDIFVINKYFLHKWSETGSCPMENLRISRGTWECQGPLFCLKVRWTPAITSEYGPRQPANVKNLSTNIAEWWVRSNVLLGSSTIYGLLCAINYAIYPTIASLVTMEFHQLSLHNYSRFTMASSNCCQPLKWSRQKRTSRLTRSFPRVLSNF